MNIKENGVIRRHEKLINDMLPYRPKWELISKYICPHRGKFDDDKPNMATYVDRGKKLLDPTPMRALSVLQSGMQSGMTSPSRAWFQLTVDDWELRENHEVMVWIDTVKDVMSVTLSKSNAYNAFHGMYGEVAGFGTGAMIVEEDEEYDIRCKLMTAGEYAVHYAPNGMPEAFARSFWMTTEDIKDRFKNMPDQVRELVERKNYDEWFKVNNLIQANHINFHGFPWVSIYWIDGQSEEADVQGYHEFPVMAPRWDTVGDDDYGTGPGHIMYRESKTLQEMRNDYLLGQKMAMQPPVVFPETARNDIISLAPGAVNYATSQGALAQSLFQFKPDVQGQTVAIQDSRQLIMQGFYNDVFMMMTQIERDMTATEVAIRQEEKLQMLGPVVERLEHELLNPFVGRVFNILNRRGKLPPPPDILAGRSVRIEYISMLALAQRASSLGGLSQLLEMTGMIAQMDQTILDKMNFDQMIDEFQRVSAIPASVIRSDDEVAQIRMQREMVLAQQAQQEQQAAQMQDLTQASVAAKNAAMASEQMPGLEQLLMGQQPAMDTNPVVEQDLEGLVAGELGV